MMYWDKKDFIDLAWFLGFFVAIILGCLFLSLTVGSPPAQQIEIVGEEQCF